MIDFESDINELKHRIKNLENDNRILTETVKILDRRQESIIVISEKVIVALEANGTRMDGVERQILDLAIVVASLRKLGE